MNIHTCTHDTSYIHIYTYTISMHQIHTHNTYNIIDTCIYTYTNTYTYKTIHMHTYIYTVHTYTHTYYAPIHISHMYTLIPIAYSMHTCTQQIVHPYISIVLYSPSSIYHYLICYHLIYTPLLYTHAIYTPPIRYLLLYVPLLYNHPLYVPMILYNRSYTTHTYISLYEHSLIIISHICHIQAIYKHIDIQGIDRPIII